VERFEQSSAALSDFPQLQQIRLVSNDDKRLHTSTAELEQNSNCGHGRHHAKSHTIVQPVLAQLASTRERQSASCRADSSAALVRSIT
jgi:hypothetical protein